MDQGYGHMEMPTTPTHESLGHMLYEEVMKAHGAHAGTWWEDLSSSERDIWRLIANNFTHKLLAVVRDWDD